MKDSSCLIKSFHFKASIGLFKLIRAKNILLNFILFKNLFNVYLMLLMIINEGVNFIFLYF